MLEVYPRYILNQDHQPIAVQIPIEQFQQITGILEASYLLKNISLFYLDFSECLTGLLYLE